jgi:hypothetical protein
MSTANVRRHLHETRNRPAGIKNRQDVQKDRFLLLLKRWISPGQVVPLIHKVMHILTFKL